MSKRAPYASPCARYELQVRKGNMNAERPHQRSQKFFYGMLGAQAAVISASYFARQSRPYNS